MVDWIADYLDGANRQHPVLAKVEPGSISAQLPADMPTEPEDPEAVWRDFQDIVLPGVTHWNHPGFMAYFGITGSGPGVLGEMLSAALDVNAMLWQTCPAATELELTVLDWLRRGLHLPDEFFGFLNDTASISTLLALAAAREAADPDSRRRGVTGRDDLAPFRVYASDQAHSSVAKACVTLGFGLDGFRAVPHDNAYRMNTWRRAANRWRWWPRSARLRPRRWIHASRLGKYALKKDFGCTLMPHTPEISPFLRNSGGALTVANALIHSILTPISGFLPQSTRLPSTPDTP
jgi:hypothetical protein